MAEVSRDAILGGRVVLAQPTRGYRVNVDAVLLAAFAAHRLGRDPGARVTPSPARALFDLGAGVGAVGLSVLALAAARRAVLVEVDSRYATLAADNVRDNGHAMRAEVFVGDVRAAARAHPAGADLVVANPPYVPEGRGRPPAEHRARARSGDVAVFLDAARTLLGVRGRACFVYPAIEATSLLGALRARGLEPKRIAFVHGAPDAPARVVLVEAKPGRPGGLVVTPPVVETDGRGRPSGTLAAVLRGEG